MVLNAGIDQVAWINRDEMEIIVRDESWARVARDLMKTRQERKKYEEVEAKLMETLKELSQHRSSRFGGFVFKSIERKGSVDYTLIPGLKCMDLEVYRRPGTVSWVLSMELEND